MPVYSDFSTQTGEDSSVAMALTSPTSISGWSIRYQETKHFGGSSGLVQRYCASGFNNVSGINVTDGANGRLVVSLRSADSSGRAGNYAYRIERLDSGFQSVLTEGYRTIVQ